MNPPAYIWIGHIPHDLRFVDRFEDSSADDDRVGICILGEAIEILSDISHELQQQTVMHECLHAICHTHGVVIERAELTEERVCRQLEGPVLALVRDNPELIAWLAS